MTITIQVDQNSVIADVDGKQFVNWTGDVNRVSRHDDFAVPRTDWLFLSSWNSQFAISEILLDVSG